MTKDFINRRPAGTSTGGQFAPINRPSSDGLRLATANWDGSVSLWDGSEPDRSPERRHEEARARSFRWHLDSARRALAGGDAPAARFHLERTRSQEPPDAASRLRRAALLVKLGEPGRAADEYARAMDDPDDDDGRNWLGWARALALAGDRAGYRGLRARLFARIAEIGPRPAPWRLVRALALGPDPADDPSALLAMAEALPERGGDAYWNLSTRALVFFRAGQWQRTVDAALKANREDPTTRACWPLLAMACGRLGRSAEADGWLRRSDAEPTTGPASLADDRLDFRILRAEAGSTSGPR